MEGVEHGSVVAQGKNDSKTHDEKKSGGSVDDAERIWSFGLFLFAPLSSPDCGRFTGFFVVVVVLIFPSPLPSSSFRGRPLPRV